ncbi:TetR-like C-terminal domain-containing protein, partial [Limosilactobacillus sp.]|uniref:TetR-like C-terminal domain-containing protein n=1 Tax=Limosilactobacillus sp. TaxID=2773925 RepID=UPI003EFFE277
FYLPPTGWLTSFYNLPIKFIEENKVVFEKLIQSGLLMERLTTNLKEKFNQQLFWPHHTKVEPEHFMALMHYVIAGSNELLIYWLDNNSGIPVAELAEMLIKLQASARDQLS